MYNVHTWRKPMLPPVIFGRFYAVLSVAVPIFGRFYAVLPVAASKNEFLSVIRPPDPSRRDSRPSAFSSAAAGLPSLHHHFSAASSRRCRKFTGGGDACRASLRSRRGMGEAVTDLWHHAGLLQEAGWAVYPPATTRSSRSVVMAPSSRTLAMFLSQKRLDDDGIL